jgi:polyribonucleotide nucleotidyltransferase
MKSYKHTLDYGDGRPITLETGKLARQAHGAVVVTMGKCVILATVVSGYDHREGTDFLPLSVDYQEKFASVGRFPGGFLKREARLSNYEILNCRIVDRMLRPLFPSDYHAETQVMISLMSAEDEIIPDTLIGLAASAAVTISDIPFDGPVSSVRIGRVDGKWIVNPFKSELENSDIDLIVAGTAQDINMVEGEMDGISEKEFVEALKVAHDYIKKQCQSQLDFCEIIGGRPEPREYCHENHDEDLKKQAYAATYQKYYDAALQPSNKDERSEKFAAIGEEFIQSLGEDVDDSVKALAKKYLAKAKKEAVRNMVLDHKKRLDGRKLNEVRPIYSEVDILPSPHGSSLFTRGETQALATVTLGSKLDEQMLDSPMNSGYSKFILHYNFPAFSTGEARPNRGPGRREIGHGNLAERGLKRMLPDQMDYTIRIVSDVLESNGSSSMATVCSGSMALMDAGIQVKSGVSGVAMGMIADDNGRYAILTDILGDEDHLGDMDFKVVGNDNGIYACQMDMKVNGLSYDVLEEALMQAKEGRTHILREMENTIAQPNSELKEHAPRITAFMIPKDKIGGVIGSGGKVIQEIQAETDTTITIEEIGDEGRVEILGVGSENMQRAYDWIQGIITDPEPGLEYTGKVTKIMEFGAFIEILPGKEGLLHISEITWERLENMENSNIQEGEVITVKLLDVDEKTGKLKLSRKVLLEKPEGYVERPQRERRSNGGGRNDRRDRNDNHRNKGNRDRRDSRSRD